MMEKSLPVGKLNPDFLESLFSNQHINDPSVIVGPQVGEDAAIIDLGGIYLVAKTDPITFATDEIGWYLTCVNGNDLATMGARPRWLLVTLLLPEGKTSEELVRGIFAQLLEACEHFNITLCGGHTEVTHGLDRPIIVGQMLGQVEKGKLIKSSGAQMGDDILLTKGIAIEAISLMARERPDTLLERGYCLECIERARDYLRDPGISVLKDAMVAMEAGGVHAMHDPTEGGLATALVEVARCSDVGMTVYPENIRIFPLCRDFCREFDINPMGVIASGALLVIADSSRSNSIIDAMADERIHCSVIGQVVGKEKGVCSRKGAERSPIPIFETDEITKIF